MRVWRLGLVCAVSALSGIGAGAAGAEPAPPWGEISAEQAVALASRYDPPAVGPAQVAIGTGQGLQPQFGALSDGELPSAGALVHSRVAADPAYGFRLDTGLIGDLRFLPLDASAWALSVALVGRAAGMAANTELSTDTIERPTALGVESIEQLRSGLAPSTFSWRVLIGPFQHLRLLGDGSVAIVDTGLRTNPGPSPATPAALSVAPTPAELRTGPPTIEAIRRLAALDAQLGKDPLAPTRAAVARPSSARSAPPPPVDSQGSYLAQHSAGVSAQSQTNGRAVAVMMAPSATDASGKPLPTGLGVRGDVITLTVDHTGSDVVYPVEVDVRTISAQAAGTHIAQLGLSTISDAAFTIPADVDYNGCGTRWGCFSATNHAPPYVLPYSVAGLEPAFQNLMYRANGGTPAEVVRITASWNIDRCDYQSVCTPPRTGCTSHDGTTDPGIANVSCVALDWYLYKLFADALYRRVRIYPMITFAPNCPAEGACRTPDDASYGAHVRALIDRYDAPGATSPVIALWSPWNEPDYSPGRSDPQIAVGYWKDLLTELRLNGCTCRGFAGEFGDPTDAYSRRYIQEMADAGLVYTPGAWTFHPYCEITYGQTDQAASLRAELNAYPQLGGARLWADEAGVQLTGFFPSGCTGSIGRKFSPAEGNDAGAELYAWGAANKIADTVRADPQVDELAYFSLDTGRGAFDSQLTETETQARLPKEDHVDANNQATPYPRPAYFGLIGAPSLPGPNNAAGTDRQGQ